MLAWTLEALAASPVVERMVVVASAGNIAEISGAPWLPERVTRVVVGGDRRQASVAAGVDALGRARPTTRPTGSSSSTMARGPLVSAALIESVARAVELHGAAIPVMPVAETVKRVAEELVAETVDRSDLVTAQTPQGVRAGLLARAYDLFPPDGPETWTDEAALLEACRIPVHVVPGDPSNLKVTQPADLRRVEAMLAGPTMTRVGIGHDSHPFGPGEPLALGGIVIDGRSAPLRPFRRRRRPPRARRRAARGRRPGRSRSPLPGGQPDPTGDPQRELLAEVRRSGRGCRLATGIGRPDDRRRPAAPRPTTSTRCGTPIADLLGLDREAVNVKASSGNLDGVRGRRSRDLRAGRRDPGGRVVTVQLHDTLSGETRPLVPLRDDGIGVYSCGPTVYGPAHIGNFRSFLFADLLVRFLRWRGEHVTWVMNITDIDDKIIRGAAATGESIETVAERYLAAFLADAAALRMTTPDVLPRATRHIDEIVALIAHAPREGQRLPHRRRLDLLPHLVVARLRPPGAARSRGAPGGGEGRGRRVRQGRRPRLRALEGTETGRAIVGDRDRPRPARLAYRVLRDEHGPPRAVVRHPYRRRRPDLPAPRGRDRPERGRHGPDVRPDVAPLRPPPDRAGSKMAKSTGNIARVGEVLAAGVSPRALRLALISVHYRAGLNSFR